jgi:hypothetical protein
VDPLQDEACEIGTLSGLLILTILREPQGGTVPNEVKRENEKPKKH